MDLKDLIYTLIVYTLAIMMILLFSQKRKHISIFILGYYSAVQIICIGSNFLSPYGDYVFNHAPQLFFVPTPFLFLLIPLFFLYIKTSVYSGYKVNWGWIYHFLPFALVLVYFMASIWFHSKEYIHELLQVHANTWRNIYISTVILFDVQYFFYCTLLLNILKDIRKNKQKLLHTVFSVSLLRVTIYLYLVGFLISVITNAIILTRIFPGYDVNFLNPLYFYFFFLFLFYITIKGFNKKDIFKYNKSETTPDDLTFLYQKISQITDSTKPFLEPMLSLGQFSESINEDSRKVSQAINHLSGYNFNDYMNYHRVELSKQMLCVKSGLTIQEIMYQSGFNSKASFNKVFKKFVKKTPTQFRNEAQSGATI